MRLAGWTVLVALASLPAALGGRTAEAAQVTPEALAAAIAKDPGYLAGEPSSTSYHRGSVTQVSASDAKAGVIAEFVVAFDYLVHDTTTGLTYRVFHDTGDAQRYYDSMSVFNAPGFERNSTVVMQSTFNMSDPKKDGFKTIKCETFLDPRAYDVTARCAALSDTAPVIVSGIRIQHLTEISQNKDGTVTHTVPKSDQDAANTVAFGLVVIGMLRVSAEEALLEAGDFANPR